MKMIQKVQLYLNTDGEHNFTAAMRPCKTEDILGVQMQGGLPCVWFLCNPQDKEMPTKFKILGTGWTLEDDLLNGYTHLGLVQQGEFVWHIFWEENLF